MVGECMGEWGELLSCPSPASKCQRDKEASSPTHETPGHSMGFPSRKGEEGAKRSILQATGRGEAWSKAEASDNGGSVPAQSRRPHPLTFFPH